MLSLPDESASSGGRRRPFEAIVVFSRHRAIRAPGRPALYARQAPQSLVGVNSLVSMVGIAVGVAVLIVVLSVVNGFQDEVRTRILGFASHVQIFGAGGRSPTGARSRAAPPQHPRVVAAAPFVDAPAMLFAGQALRGALLRGVDPQAEERVAEFGRYMRSGSLAALKPGEYGVRAGRRPGARARRRAGRQGGAGRAAGPGRRRRLSRRRWPAHRGRDLRGRLPGSRRQPRAWCTSPTRRRSTDGRGGVRRAAQARRRVRRAPGRRASCCAAAAGGLRHRLDAHPRRISSTRWRSPSASCSSSWC